MKISPVTHQPKAAPAATPPGDRCTSSRAADTGRAERDGDMVISGWAVNTGGSGPQPDLRTYAQQSSDSNHWAARGAVAATAISAVPHPIARAIGTAVGVASGLAWDASQSQADRAAKCP